MSETQENERRIPCMRCKIHCGEQCSSGGEYYVSRVVFDNLAHENARLVCINSELKEALAREQAKSTRLYRQRCELEKRLFPSSSDDKLTYDELEQECKLLRRALDDSIKYEREEREKVIQLQDKNRELKEKMALFAENLYQFVEEHFAIKLQDDEWLQLKDKIGLEKTENDKLKQRIRELELDINSWQRKHSTWRMLHTELNDSFSLIETMVRDDLQKELSDKNSRIADLEQQLEYQSNQFKHDRARWEEQSAWSNEWNGKLQNRLDNSARKVRELETRVTVLEQRNSELCEELGKTRAENRVLQLECKRQQNDLAEYDDRCTEEHVRYREAKERFLEMSKLNKDLRQKVSALDDQRDALEEQVFTLQKCNLALLARNTVLRNAYAVLRGRLGSRQVRRPPRRRVIVKGNRV